MDRSRAIIAGNWKMHGSQADVCALLTSLKSAIATIPDDVDVLVFPSFVHLALTQTELQHTSIRWGAQNMYPGASGAFTGEISPPMLKDYGCHSVLIGHSERRHVLHEDLSFIAAKVQAALQYGVQPILCVGETLEERQQGMTETIVNTQLSSALAGLDQEALAQVVIAYEPVWAIGTGLTAKPEEAQAVHAFIRQWVAGQGKAIAQKMPILYGGSVKPDNAAGLFAMPDIDGGLIGGASLSAPDFLSICRCSNAIYNSNVRC